MKNKRVLPGLTRGEEMIAFKIAPTIGAALMGAMMFRGYGLCIGALVEQTEAMFDLLKKKEVGKRG